MQLYELVNPSDPYTMYCDDPAVAAATMLFLGSGQYTLTPFPNLDPLGLAAAVPFFAFGVDVKEWFEENHDIEDLDAWLRDHREDIAAVLETVLIGRPEQRVALDEKLDEMDEEDRETFLNERHEKMRSSLNDIGLNAAMLAEALREGFKDEEPKEIKEVEDFPEIEEVEPNNN